MYRLEVSAGDGLPLVFLLREGTHSIGRNPDNDIMLTDSGVSRSHCLIYVRQGYVEIEDLGSANGVIIGGDRAFTRVELPLGEEFKIGDTTAVLRPEMAESARETTIFVRDETEK